MNPIQGRKVIIHRVDGTPKWSANKPRRAAPSPPIPKAKPRINPEAIPTFFGKNDWPRAMDMEKEKINMNPAKVSQIKDQAPLLRKKRANNGPVHPRLKRMIFL